MRKQIGDWFKQHPPAIALSAAFAYLLLAVISQELIYPHSYSCAFWPAAGVGAFAVLVGGRWGALGTWLGSFGGVIVFFSQKSELEFPALLLFAGATATGAMIEGILVAVAVNRWFSAGADLLARIHKQFWFVPISLGCALPSVVFGVGVGYVFGVFRRENILIDGIYWVVGDTLGLLLVLPLLLSGLTERSTTKLEDPKSDWLGFIVFALSVALACLGFGMFPPFIYILFPLIVVASFYFRQGWILLSMVVTVAIAVFATLRGRPPLHSPDGDILTALNLYLVSFALTMIALCSSTGAAVRLRRTRATELANDAREEAEDRLLEVSPVGIGWSFWDHPNGKFRKMNPKLAHQFGYSSENEFKQYNDGSESIYFNIEDRRKLIKALERAPQESQGLRLVVRCKGGRLGYIHLDAKLVEVDGHREILGFARNVTEIVQRETYYQTIQAITERLTNTKIEDPWIHDCLKMLCEKLEASRVALWLAVDPDMGLNVPNEVRQFDSTTDVSPVMNSKTAECIFSDESAKSPYTYRLVDEDKIIGVITVYVPGWLFTNAELGCVPIEDNDQRTQTEPRGRLDEVSLQNLVVSVGQMIYQACSREIAEFRLGLVFAKAPFGLFMCNSQGRNFYFNPELKRLDGVPPDVDITEWDWLEQLTPNCRPQVEEKWKRYLAAPPENGTMLTEYYSRDGDTYLYEVDVKPIQRKGTIIRHFGVVYDVTARQRASAEAMVLVARMKHDANNVFVAMNGALDLIESQNLDELVRDTLNRLKGHLREIRAIAGGSVRREQFDPHDLVKSLMAEHSLDGVNVDLRTGPVISEGAAVEGDVQAFRSVFRNLFVNALKSAKLADDPAITLVIELDGTDAKLRLRMVNPFRDTPPEEYERVRLLTDLEILIELANRTEHRGLLFSRLTMLRCGGDLSIEVDHERQQFVATMAMPISLGELAHRFAAIEDEMPLRGVGPIMLIDDRAEVLNALSLKLRQWGVECVCSAQRATEAENLVRAARGFFKFVLIDTVLLGENGEDLAMRLRCNPELLSDCRLVSISSGQPPEVRGPFDAHLSKDLWYSAPQVVLEFFKDASCPAVPQGDTTFNLSDWCINCSNDAAEVLIEQLRKLRNIADVSQRKSACHDFIRDIFRKYAAVATEFSKIHSSDSGFDLFLRVIQHEYDVARDKPKSGF